MLEALMTVKSFLFLFDSSSRDCYQEALRGNGKDDNSDKHSWGMGELRSQLNSLLVTQAGPSG